MSFISPKYISSSITSTCLKMIAMAVPSPSFTFTFSLLSSFPSHGTQPNHNNVISDFLLNECGLCPSEVTIVFKRYSPWLRTRSAHTAKEAVQLLRDSGFTQDQLKKIIVRCPSIFTRKVDGQLKLKLEFLKTLGLSDQDLPNLIYGAPRLLTYSLENNIRPTISCLESLFGSKTNVAKALRRAPNLMDCNIKSHLRSKLDLLRNYGSIQGELLSILISQKPDILTRFSAETLKAKIEYVNNMGFLQGSHTFMYVFMCVACNTHENVERKMKHMANLGLLKEEIDVLIKKFPKVLLVSTNKMQKNMDFLIHTARLPPNIVVTYPSLFNYSLEKRLKPRHEVFKALSSMKQAKGLPSLVSMFRVSEREFLKKFIEYDPEASVLKGIHKGNSANIIII